MYFVVNVKLELEYRNKPLIITEIVTVNSGPRNLITSLVIHNYGCSRNEKNLRTSPRFKPGKID